MVEQSDVLLLRDLLCCLLLSLNVGSQLTQGSSRVPITVTYLCERYIKIGPEACPGRCIRERWRMLPASDSHIS